MKPKELAELVRAGDKRAIAKAISIVEELDEDALDLLHFLQPYTGNAHIIGITGPAGVGKSTLTDRVIREYRKLGKKVGIIGVDPTSPFTGGALLGDRIRMQRHATDPGVYIRSMATRGSIGALSRAAIHAAKVLDAAGFDVVIIETVGSGQADMDIIGSADTIVLVLMPSLGDDIQALKAGVMEAADIIVINKADLPGADGFKAMIELSLDLKEREWPKIVCTSAVNGTGIKELMEAFQQHREYLISSGKIKERRRRMVIREIEGVLLAKVVSEFVKRLEEEISSEEDIYPKMKEMIKRVREALAEIR